MVASLQPVSRLMNRFTKDVNGIDTLLVSSLSTFTVNAATGILSILVIIGVSPWLLIAIPFLFVIYW